MSSYKLSKKADADFVGIWNYTFDTWGELQADKYTDSLKNTCTKLAISPEQAKSVDYIRAGYFKFKMKKHDIYFREIESGIEIVRILHEKMDVNRHLQ